jgi:hypothetical protein
VLAYNSTWLQAENWRVAPTPETRNQTITSVIAFQLLVSFCHAQSGESHSIGIDTGYVCTYTVQMNVTLSIDEKVVARARKKAKTMGKSLNELIREYLQKLAGGDDPERSIEEFEHLSGRGHSRGWRFNRDEIHERS